MKRIPKKLIITIISILALVLVNQTYEFSLSLSQDYNSVKSNCHVYVCCATALKNELTLFPIYIFVPSQWCCDEGDFRAGVRLKKERRYTAHSSLLSNSSN